MNNSTRRLARPHAPIRDTEIIGAAAGINRLPAPLTPADCDLRDHVFIPLDVAHVRNFSLVYCKTPEARGAAVLLCCVSWHQLPAASLPDDNEWLAKCLGYWHRGKVDKDWSEIREGALRDWVKCSDGRLYHPVVAANAREAWAAKLGRHFTPRCSPIKKDRQRRRIECAEPDFDAWTDTRTLQDSQHEKTCDAPSEKMSTRARSEAKPTTRCNGRTTCGTNASAGSCQKHAMSTADISASLISWERERGKTTRGFSINHVHIVALAALALTPNELREAYNSAVTDRLSTNDLVPVSANFIKKLVINHRSACRPKPYPHPDN